MFIEKVRQPPKFNLGLLVMYFIVPSNTKNQYVYAIAFLTFLTNELKQELNKIGNINDSALSILLEVQKNCIH